MLQIQQITSAPLQQQALTLDDGTRVTIKLYFRPMQYGWFLEELTYGSFVLRGLRISNSPNMLYQWRNLLPFGIACFSSGNREPMLQQDFSSGASKLYLLTKAEVDRYTEILQE